jgi:hypothetical protein
VNRQDAKDAKKSGALLGVLALLAVSLSLCACASSARIPDDICSGVGAGADLRARFRELNCLTALVSADPARASTLAPRVQRGFEEIYRRLLREPLFDEHVAQWTELYRLSARFYPRQTALGGEEGFPITLVNAHHFSVPFWIRHAAERPLGTLLHFDTHSDMEGIPRPDDVREAVGQIRAGRNLRKSWHILAHAVYRNSMPVSAAVLAAGISEVVWAKPSWARDPVDFLSRSFFYASPTRVADPPPLASLESQGPTVFAAAFRMQTSDLFELRYDPADNGGRWLPRREREPETWGFAGAAMRPHEKFFRGVKALRFSVVTADRPGPKTAELVRAVSGDRFLLDIDLDYFVNVGSESTLNNDDPPSFGQRTVQHKGDPDTVVETEHQRYVNAAKLTAERRRIRRRIERFRDVLWALRHAGKRPTLVSIADSANLPFTARREGEEGSEFVPTHHAYWVHDSVVNVVKSVFGDGAGEVPREPAPETPRAGERPRGGKGDPALLARLRHPLAAAMAWSTAALAGREDELHFSAHLLVLHAIARHGPGASLRRAAREAARIHAAATLTPVVLGPPLAPTAARLSESLRRILFAERYGNAEASVALAAGRWLASSLRVALPDLDAETAPLAARQALDALGLRGAEPGEAAERLLALQSPDGAFAPASGTAAERVAMTLAAVRGLLGLLPPAPLPALAEAPWSDTPVTSAAVDRAVLRGALFALVRSGQSPSLETGIEALRLLARAARIDGNPAAALVGDAGGRVLAPRLAAALAARLAGERSLEGLLALADASEALGRFGVPVTTLREVLARRLGRFREEQALGVRTPTSVELAAQALERSYRLESLGLWPGAYSRALLQALSLLGRTEPRSTAELILRLRVLWRCLETASAGRGAPLPRGQLGAELSFLTRHHEGLLATRRAEAVSALGAARALLGDSREAAPYRDIVWQLLHEQDPDGSWGLHKPDERLRTTRTALAALATFRRAEPTFATRAAARILEERAGPKR